MSTKRENNDRIISQIPVDCPNVFFQWLKIQTHISYIINICDVCIIYLKGHETPVTLSAGHNRTVEKIRVPLWTSLNLPEI